MKNFKLVFLTIIIFVTANSCKKGKDDPFFSLQSRKKRLSKQWVLIEGNQTLTETINNETRTTETVFSNDSIKMTISDIQTMSFKYSEIINFDIDNNFYILSEYPNYLNQGAFTIIISGKWEFLPSDGNYKNKERVRLLAETQTTTFVNNSVTINYAENGLSLDYILQVTRLSKNNLIFNFTLTMQDGSTTIEITGSKEFIDN